MTYYIHYKWRTFTVRESPNGTLAVRFARGQPLDVSLHFDVGDVVEACTKAGKAKFVFKVRAFVPRVVYGQFTRSGYIVYDWKYDSNALQDMG